MSVAIILMVSAAVATWRLLPGEQMLRVGLLAWATPPVRDLAYRVSDAGTWRLLVPAGILLLALSRRARQRWWLWTGILLFAPILGDGWKQLIGRPRPIGTALGFPSGHAAAAAALAMLVAYFATHSSLRRAHRYAVSILAGLGMLMVGLARILLDAHWLADVLVGFAFGAACASAGIWWDTAVTRQRVQTGDPARPPR
jgi:membrane-associated phospholipid phosphatase